MWEPDMTLEPESFNGFVLRYREVLANFMLPDGMTLDDLDNPITHDWQEQYADAVKAQC